MTKKSIPTSSANIPSKSPEESVFGYKIIRLHSGEDVIAAAMSVEGSENSEIPYVILREPMHLLFKRISTGTAAILLPWLPVEFLEDNEAVISYRDILTILEPNEKLINTYEAAVDKLNDLLQGVQDTENYYSKNPQEESEEDLDDYWSSLENESSKVTIH